MMVDTYLRRGKRDLDRLLLNPGIRTGVAIAAYGGGGFLLSAAGLAQLPQPLVVGLISAGTGWRTLMMTLGAMAGYPSFWGSAGSQGIVWSAATGVLTLLLGKREEIRQQPLMLPVLVSFLTVVTGLVFFLMFREQLPVTLLALRAAISFGASVLFIQADRQRDALTDWLAGGAVTLALAGIQPVRGLGLGYVAAGLVAVRGSLPAAVIAGLGLDLARVTQIPMTAALTGAWLIRAIPFDKKWQHYASGCFACAGVMVCCGIRDLSALPGLALGGGLAWLLPQQPKIPLRRGQTGSAQVRLELGAELMAQVGDLLQEQSLASVDREAVFSRAVEKACGNCPSHKNCRERQALESVMLQQPEKASCRETARLRWGLGQGKEQLRSLIRERQRLGEYRYALIQQYRFLESYLHRLADSLPRSGGGQQAAFRVEAAARSRGKERVNGDRCMAFPGPGCRYYLLLCDGMGTGLGAAAEGDAAAKIIRRLLEAGFPSDHALRSVNSLLVLQGNSGAVTIDLAEIHLDTGLAVMYKWGAAPSWVLHRSSAEKIGTASPPPGIAVNGTREIAVKLSLCRGEPLILLSDGVDGEDVLHRLDVTPDAPPGELAANILEKSLETAEDDITAAVIRLYPIGLVTS